MSVLIHIGYPKTGSTWLQRYLFNNHEMGFSPLFDSDAATRQHIVNQIILPNPLIFDLLSCSRIFKTAIERQDDNNRTIVLSHERLTGTPHSGGFDSVVIANRLAELFPESKILIVIREQKNIILSSYKQYVRNGGVCSLLGYLYPPSTDTRIPLFNFEFFEYHRLISLYLDLFSNGNVLVLPYELMLLNPYEFVFRITSFCGISTDSTAISKLQYSKQEYSSLSFISTSIKRQINRFVARKDSLNPQVLIPLTRKQELKFERILMRFDYLIPKKFSEKSEIKHKTIIADIVGERYQESNQILSEAIHFDLGKYCYDSPVAENNHY